MKRSAFRFVLLAVLVLVVLVVGIVVLIRSMADSRFVQLEAAAMEQLGPIDLGAYAPEPDRADDGPTAVERLQERMPAFSYSNQTTPEVRRLGRRSAAQWSAEDRERVRQELLERAATVAALRGLTALPLGAFDLDYKAGLAIRLPDVFTLLEHALVLRLHAGAATLDGDLASAVTSVEAQGVLVRVLDREAVILLQLFALRIEQLQLWAIHDLLAAGLDDPTLTDRLTDSLRDREPAEVMRRMAGYELATLLDLLRDQRRGLGRLTEDSWRSSILDSTVGPWFTVQALERHLAAAMAAEHPWPEARGYLGDATEGDLPGPYEDLVTNYRLPLRDLLANAAVAGLARHALTTAGTGVCRDTAGMPAEERWISPFSGAALRVLTLEDGDCALSLPKDRELWDEEVARDKPPEETLPAGWSSAPDPDLPWTWILPGVEPAN